MRIQKYLPSGIKPNVTFRQRLKTMGLYMYTIVNFILTGIHYIMPEKSRHLKYQVSLCLIFKNEARYLREWIEYHKLIGVEHFYLYNNFSDDNFREVLKPYLESNDVTLVEWPYQYAQVQAYEDAMKNFKEETQWIGFIDADEFINLRSDNNIVSFLKKYKNYPAVFFNWRMFGTSGNMEYDNSTLITERFTSCWDCLTDVGKSFVNTDYNLLKMHPHFSIMKYCGLPIFPVGLNKIPNILFKSIWEANISTKGYVNHYWSKSFDEYYYKDFNKGDVSSEQNIRIKLQKGRFEYHELQNTQRDYSIQRWLVLLKKGLNDKL